MTVALLLLLAASLIVLIVIATRRGVSPLLSVSLFFTFFLWYVIPIGTNLAAPERRQYRTLLPLDEFVRFAVLELSAFLLTLVLYAIGGKTFRSIVRGRVARYVPPRPLLTLAVIGGAVATAIVRWKIISITGVRYTELNTANVLAQGSGAAAALLTLTFIDGMLLALAAACAITPMRRRPLLRIIVWLWVIGASMATVMVGGRLALLTPCALLLMALHERHPSRKLMAATYGGVILFAATGGVLLTLVVADIRATDAITLSGISEGSKSIVQERSTLSDKLWEFFDHLNQKFDGISAGAYLVDEFGSAQAGARPYAGAFLAIVPRQIVGAKPVPGSVDGTARGLPSVMVASALGYDPEFGNVGVSPAAIALWQFGMLGIIPLVIINYLNLRLINSLLLQRSVATRTLAMFLIGVPAFIGIFGPGEFVIMNAERTLALYVMATLALVLMPQPVPRHLVQRTEAP